MPAASLRDVAMRCRSMVFECMEERAGQYFSLGEENVSVRLLALK